MGRGPKGAGSYTGQSQGQFWLEHGSVRTALFLASLAGSWASDQEAALKPSGLLHAVPPRPRLQDTGPTRDLYDHHTARVAGCCRPLVEGAGTGRPAGARRPALLSLGLPVSFCTFSGPCP